MQVVVNNMLINYSDSGSGETVLLLHGWGDSIATFDRLKQFLSNSYRIIAVDLPGFGGSDSPKEPYMLANYADFLKDFLTKLGERPKLYAVVGHSNGGAIALKALSMNTLRVDKLVLLASSGIRSNYTARKKALRIAAKAAKVPLKLLPKVTQAKLKKKAYQKIGSDLFVAEHLQETFKNVVSEDLLGQISNIKTDTLLLYGENDAATPVSYGESFNSVLPKSKLEVVKDAGHFLHIERTEKVNAIIKDFLDA